MRVFTSCRESRSETIIRVRCISQFGAFIARLDCILFSEQNSEIKYNERYYWKLKITESNDSGRDKILNLAVYFD